MNKKRPLLTIIVPVYKSEKYIGACLDSILSQTLKDYELILVDDGSPDGTGKICDSYAAMDNRIKVIHKTNGGVGAARNSALNIATGKYITFIDSDDEYGSDTTLEENMSIMTENHAIDYLQYPYVYMDNGNENLFSVPEKLLTSKVEILNYMLDDKIKGYLWNKVFRADLFEDVRFPENLTVTEDLYVLIDLLEKVNTVYFSQCGLYSYYKRENSIVVAKSLEKEMDCAGTYRKLLSITELYPAVNCDILAKRFFGTLSHLLNMYAMFGLELGDEFDLILPYMPKNNLLFGKLKVKYKLKILQIRVFGVRRFAKWNICLKRRRIS